MEQELFRDLPEVPTPAKANPAGAARMREPARDQIEWLLMNWDGLIGADHPARVFWDYVQKIDLSALEDAIKAREHTPGQAPPSPQLMMALWLYAASQGVGSARALAQLCTQHDAYRWLCGGVSMNYHTLSDFRTLHGKLLERLLIEHVASLSAAKVINLDEVMQDGLRVRAAAGAGSFHREESTQAHLDKATSLIERLKQEQEGDFEASNRRIKAARERSRGNAKSAWRQHWQSTRNW